MILKHFPCWFGCCSAWRTSTGNSGTFFFYICCHDFRCHGWVKLVTACMWKTPIEFSKDQLMIRERPHMQNSWRREPWVQSRRKMESKKEEVGVLRFSLCLYYHLCMDFGSYRSIKAFKQTDRSGVGVLVNIRWRNPGHVTVRNHLCTPDVELFDGNFCPSCNGTSP